MKNTSNLKSPSTVSEPSGIITGSCIRPIPLREVSANGIKHLTRYLVSIFGIKFCSTDKSALSQGVEQADISH